MNVDLKCPVCSTIIPLESLIQDGLVLRLLGAVGSGVVEIRPKEQTYVSQGGGDVDDAGVIDLACDEDYDDDVCIIDPPQIDSISTTKVYSQLPSLPAVAVPDAVAAFSNEKEMYHHNHHHNHQLSNPF